MDFRLATGVSCLEKYLADYPPSHFWGHDTEATHLDTRRARLVGTSISTQAGSAIYVPLAHRLGTNVPLLPTIDVLKTHLSDLICLNYNAKYDRNIVQAASGWEPPNFRDVLELVYLADPDRKEKGLKKVAKEDLGYDMAQFESLFSPEEVKSKRLDISTKDPARCVDYACADAEVLMRLYPLYKSTEDEFSFAVKIDTKLVDIIRKVEHNGGMCLNREYVDKQIRVLGARAAALQEQIWRMVGYGFDIESPKQLGIALFDRLGIPSPGMTAGKNPQHKTDADNLEGLAVVYPVIELVICYRKVTKAKGTYFQKLVRLDDLKIPVRFCFNMVIAPTFRFAAPGGDPDRDGFTGINIQAVSNGELRDLMAVDLREEKKEDNYLDQVTEEDLLIEAIVAENTVPTGSLEKPTEEFPYVVPFVVKDSPDALGCIREVCKGCTGDCSKAGVDQTRRLIKNMRMVPSVRHAFMAPPGFKLVSFDYDRQELVIGANLSGEPKWITALKNKEDLHIQSACDAYGISLARFLGLSKEEIESKRDIGKMLNFAIFYGATAFTISRKANIPRVMAEQMYDRYKLGHPTLFNWIAKVQIFARKSGFTTTYFGRRRWLKQFYAMSDPKMHKFADRSAVNSSIQGTGAEVTRIAIVKVDRALKDLGVGRKDIWLAMQIHDELMYVMRDEVIKDLAPVVADNMSLKVKSWQVQLSVTPKIGQVWGLQKKLKLENIADWEQLVV